MRIIERIKEMADISRKVKNKGKKVGLVPTMGALHEGHFRLIDVAKKHTDFVVVSIFVNPLQFGVSEDLRAYPRDVHNDAKLLKKKGIDILFAPLGNEMYPEGYDAYVELPMLSSVLCGARRPGHFKGVCTVVCKLFNIVIPDIAVFGEKDAQQLIIIKRMVKDLNLGIKILTTPTMRESDGVAISSRNIYLSSQERKDTPVIYQSLILAKKLIEKGERDTKKIKEKMRIVISSKLTARVDYMDIVKKKDLKQINFLEGEVLIAVAVWFGKTRLIDNITLQIPEI